MIKIINKKRGEISTSLTPRSNSSKSSSSSSTVFHLELNCNKRKEYGTSLLSYPPGTHVFSYGPIGFTRPVCSSNSP